MIIAFFGLTPGSGASNSLAMFGITSVISKHKKILMIENTAGELKVPQYLFPGSLQKMTREKLTSYYGYGTHSSIAESISRRTGKRLSFSCSIELIKDYLYYLPQSDTYKNASSINFYEYSLPLLIQSSSIFDDIYIETHPGDSNLKDILNIADLVVVCLKQNQNALYDYYSLYSSLLPKSHFLICNYKQNKKPAVSDFLRKFGISSSCISTIPYNASFEAALSRGELFNFIYDNYQGLKGKTNHPLIAELEDIVDRLGYLKTVHGLEGKEIISSVF